MAFTNWREFIRKSMAETSDVNRDPAAMMRDIAKVCQQRAAIVKSVPLPDEERLWLVAIRQSAEMAIKEISAVLGPEMATQEEAIKVKTDFLRNKQNRRLRGV